MEFEAVCIHASAFSAFLRMLRTVASLRMLPFASPPFLYYPHNRGRSLTRHPIERWFDAMHNHSFPAHPRHGAEGSARWGLGVKVRWRPLGCQEAG